MRTQQVGRNGGSSLMRTISKPTRTWMWGSVAPAQVALCLIAVLAFSPAVALANGGRGGPPGGGPGMTGTAPGRGDMPAGKPGAGQPFAPGRHGQHRHFHRPHMAFKHPRAFYYSAPSFYGIGVYGGPGLYGSVDYPPPVETAPAFDPPVIYSVPAAYPPIVSPDAPPGPSVIEYPGGRYELRGDGVSFPYMWVWIPNPPAEPPTPAAPPPADPPTPSTAPEPPPSADVAPSRPSRLYRWVDAHGAVHLTDDPELVPEQYRQP